MGEVIRQMKSGRFVGYYLRYYDSSGKRRMIASGVPTHADALRKLREIEGSEAAARRTGEPAVQPKALEALTVAEVCAAYLESSHFHVKDAGEYRKKSAYSLRAILQLLGHLQIAALKRKDVEKARDMLSKRLKANSVRACLRPLSAALTWAVREEYISTSPMSGMRQPRRTQSTDRLSQEEAAALLQVAREDGDLYVPVALALRQGLRRGEICGLRWCDVDLRNSRLTVARSYQGTPKNGKTRTLPLHVDMASDLAEWRQQQQPDDRVCPLSAREQRQISKLLGKITSRSFDRPWHVLRHTFASLFIESGGSIVALKEVLGHSTLEMSLLYSHVAPAALAADLSRLKI